MKTGDGNIQPVGNNFFACLTLRCYESFTAEDNGNTVNQVLRFKTRIYALQQLLAGFPGVCINRLFTSLPEEKIIELMNKARSSDSSYNGADLRSYYNIFCPQQTVLNEVRDAVLRSGLASLVYTQGRAGGPSANTAMEQFFMEQGYLGPAPGGINAKYAWQFPGGKGKATVAFIDIEQGWQSDNTSAAISTLPLTGSIAPASQDHGTAVFHIIMKKENANGTTGITPEAAGYIISQWRPDGTPNDADAILAAVSYLNYGDILLLESQSYCQGYRDKLWPIEIQDACFEVIRLATALGIIVIEAAGNGDSVSGHGNDLDTFELNGQRVMCASSASFRDSGAIVVAAASLTVPHKRIMYSNYGSRINCYSWGEGIASVESDGGYSGTGNNSCIRRLNGTSSAAAVIAGAAIAVQSMFESNFAARLGPQQMRAVLSGKEYGTESANGQDSDKIGVMPDLKKIIHAYMHL